MKSLKALDYIYFAYLYRMNKFKNIVILVSDYPYGTGEPFLEDEVKLLSEVFENIYFFHTTDRSIEADRYSLFAPKNSKVILLNKDRKSSFFNKIKLFFSITFYYELLLAVFKHKRKFSIKLFQLIAYYWSNAYQGERCLKLALELNSIKSEETLFYSYWCDEYAISLAKLAKKEKINFVVRLHGWDLYFERHQVNFLPFREFIFNNAQRIFTISNDGRKYIIDKRLCLNRSKIITARLGVQDLSTNILYDKKLFENNRLRILTLSHINKVKRLDRIVDVLKEIGDIDISWYHIGYGYKEFESEFKQYTHDNLKDKQNVDFHFLGHLTKKEVLSYIVEQPIDIILNVSDTEGIPVSLMEAASASLPIIAFSIGGIPSVIKNNSNGYLLDLKSNNNTNILQLKNAIIQFNSLNFDERIFFSKASKLSWYNNFNNENTTNFFIDSIKNQIHPNIIVCEQCLVDSNIYPSIVLDKYGICDICSIVESKNKNVEENRANNYLQKLLTEIKSNSKHNKYDCIIGISGGVDSAYLAVKAKEWGLNPLLVHVDNGWNSEIAVSNIYLLIKQLGFDLYTVVINWNELRDLVRSFLKASVIDIDWANEMCAQAALNEVAKKFKIKHVLTGHQLATEGWMPDNVVHYKLDLINFKAIHRKFGKVKLKTYPKIGFFKTYYYEKILGIRFYYPLDYIEYNKEKVKKQLSESYGWKDYGQKHFESIFTRFYQGYLLIKKFKIDKRKFHYSSSILSGQLTKPEAQALVDSNEYIESGMMEEDKQYICKKLGFTESEFEEIIQSQPKKHIDYPSMINFLNKLRKIKHVIQNNR